MSLLPETYASTLLKQLHEAQKQQTRIFEIARGIDPDNRPTVTVQVPCSPEWLEARTEFAGRWAALIAEGFKHGYLEDYDGLEITDNTSTYEEHPNPDYDPDKPNPYVLPEGTTSITIPRSAR